MTDSGWARRHRRGKKAPLQTCATITQDRDFSWAPYLLSLIVIGFHTSFTLELGDRLPLPMSIAGFAACIVTLLKPYRLLDISRPLALYFLLAFIINVWTYDGYYAIKYITGLGQLAYSLWIAQCTYILVTSIEPSKLSIVCLIMIGTITVVAVAELAPGMSVYFDILYGILGSASEVNEARDMAFHGAVRARALALEPSHAALTLSALSYCFFWTVDRRLYLMLWLFAMLVSIWAIRSPILLITLLAATGFQVLSFRLDKALASLFALSLGLVALFFMFEDAFNEIFLSRFAAFTEGEGSFVMRMVAPFMFFWEKMPENILTGSGVVGNLDMYATEIQALYIGMGMRYISIDLAPYSLTNNVALHFIYFGLIGGLISARLLIAAAEVDNSRCQLVLLLQILTLWLGGGGYISPRIWCMSAMLVAAARSHEARAVRRKAVIDLIDYRGRSNCAVEE